MIDLNRLPKDYYIDFGKLAIGQKVYSLINGWVKVDELDFSELYPIVAGVYSFTKNGVINIDDKYPTLYAKNPLEYEGEPVEITKVTLYELIENFKKANNIVGGIDVDLDK